MSIAYIARVVISLALLSTPLLTAETANAAALTAVSDTMSRNKAATASNHTIHLTTGTGAGDITDTITLTFPAGFTIGSVDYTDIDLSYGASTGAETEATLAATPSGTAWGAAFSGQVLTLTHPTDGAVGDIAASDKVIIEIGTNAAGGNAQIANPAASTYTVTIAGDFGDTGSFSLTIATEDQVSISSTVDPFIAFNVTDANVALGTLSRTQITTDTATMTAATNSDNGYSITVNGGTLTHTLDGSYTITAIGDSATASSPGNEQFGFKVSTNGVGAGAAVAPYNTANYAFNVAGVPDEVAASAGASDTTTYTMTYMANIGNLTEPGTYTATHTYIFTGNF